MAQSSQDILNQINQQYGNIGSAANTIESTIKNAYAPSIKALVEEGNTLRGQYYPAFFNEAQKLGTTAADMSPAARLAAMQQAGENMGQLYRTNLGLRDFFNTDINNLVGRAQNQYNAGYGALKDMYTMALQGEQARQAAAAQSAAIRAAQAQADYFKNLGKTTTTPVDLNTVPDVITLDADGYDLIKNINGKTQSPILDSNGKIVGYNILLPNGKMVQGALPDELVKTITASTTPKNVINTNPNLIFPTTSLGYQQPITGGYNLPFSGLGKSLGLL